MTSIPDHLRGPYSLSAGFLQDQNYF